MNRVENRSHRPFGARGRHSTAARQAMPRVLKRLTPQSRSFQKTRSTTRISPSTPARDSVIMFATVNVQMMKAERMRTTHFLLRKKKNSAYGSSRISVMEKKFGPE